MINIKDEPIDSCDDFGGTIPFHTQIKTEITMDDFLDLKLKLEVNKYSLSPILHLFKSIEFHSI